MNALQADSLTHENSLSPSGVKSIRFGMVGVAGFGKYRREKLREVGGFQPVAYFDRLEDILVQACEEDGAKPVDSFEKLLEEPNLDAVVISTGVDTHAHFGCLALEAGLHVFIEKPLCATPGQMAQLVKARDKSGCIVGMGHNFDQANPILKLISQYEAEGLLGTITAYEKNSSHSGGLQIQEGDWRGDPENNPGGMLMQCGVHSFHTQQTLFGPIREVAAFMRSDVHPGTRTADVASVLVRHESGMVGNLNCYHITGYNHSFRVFGTKGNLYFDTQEWKAWYQERKINELEEGKPVSLNLPGDAYSLGNLANWKSAILNGTPVVPSLEDGIRAVAPVFAADRSDKEGRKVTIAEILAEVGMEGGLDG